MTVRIIASISGGKDSTAMGLWLLEQGLSFEPVFCDTGWEHPDTYRYVREVLPRVFGPIKELRSEPELSGDMDALAQTFEARLGFRSPFIRWVLRKGMFPSRVRRFCTEELKVFPIRDHLRAILTADPGATIINAVGIRAAESQSRGKMPEREPWGVDGRGVASVEVWRPLIRWTFEDVAEIHRRHGLKPNPLYFDQNVDRVGCYPCIHARKTEIKAVSEFDTGRIGIIRDLERAATGLARARASRRALKPIPDDLDDDEIANEMDLRDPSSDRQRRCFFEGKGHERGRGSLFVPIDRVVEWSRTDRGGRQFPLFELDNDAADGCMRWGMCETGAP